MSGILGFTGTELQGIGAVASALANVYSIKQQSDYNKEMMSLEKDRISQNRETDKKRQEAYESIWGSSFQDEAS